MIIQTVEIAGAPRTIPVVAICPVCHTRGTFMAGNGHGTQIMCTGSGHKPLACGVRRIRMGTNPYQKCDIRCTSAKGFTCNCSCGGRNHGIDLLTEVP